jgi:hypothetical protein
MSIAFWLAVAVLGIGLIGVCGAALAQASLDASDFHDDWSRFEAVDSLPIAELERLEESGDSDAQAALGVRYMVGDGVSADAEHGFQLLEQSARQGNAIAEEALGNAFYLGKGTAVDYAKAFYWNRRAAMQGHPSGIYSTGYFFASGIGTEPDFVAAFVWLSLLPKRKDAVYEELYQFLEDWLTDDQRASAAMMLSKCVASGLQDCP